MDKKNRPTENMVEADRDATSHPHQLQTRFTEVQYNALDIVARRLGTKPSTYVRHATLRALIQDAKRA